MVSAPRERLLSRGRPIRTARRGRRAPARRSRHHGRSDPSSPGRAEFPGRGRQGGACGGHIVDHQHPEPANRARRHEDRPPTALLRRSPGLGRTGPAGEAGPDGHAEAPADRPGEMLRLVEAPALAPDGSCRRPGDDVDRAERLLPQALDQGGGQDREDRPRVAVFQPGERFPYRPFVGEGGHPLFHRRGSSAGGRRPGARETGGAQGRLWPAAADAAGREKRFEQGAEDLHAPEPIEGV
jgi:hypothetical protein